MHRVNHFIISCLLIAALGFSLVSCSVRKFENIEYVESENSNLPPADLNIFQPRYVEKENVSLPVLIFVYGGNWNSGRKKTYGYVGRNFARHDMIAVLPDYTKSPAVNYQQMTAQIAASINWVYEHIDNYGGDPERIFITGHSAGGHLAALATMNPQFDVPTDRIKGIVLNDAAGLDMETYLRNNPPSREENYLSTWTSNPDQWKNASPINFIDQETPPIKSYVGTKTYPSIKRSNDRFYSKLLEVQPQAQRDLLDKRHVPMVTHLFWPWSSRFEEIKKFMDN
jgi:acetyl esterase/lipase